MAKPLQATLVIRRYYDGRVDVIKPEDLGLSPYTGVEGMLIAYASGKFSMKQHEMLWPGDTLTVFENEEDLQEHLAAITL